MRVASYIQDSIVDGKGLRFTLFAQGCIHRCEGCHNPQTHDPEGGTEMSVDEIVEIIMKNPLTDGVTFSGGEPFLQPQDCAKIAREVKAEGLNVWAYTGFIFEDLLSDEKPAVREFLALCDVLIDGPFILADRSLGARWIGSKNQRVIDVKKSLATGRTILYD